ncbi:hypothetical protein RhiirC2_791791 [Rhizophagus irregularis]|uniref:Uncharacterized protein n=1 Tax=Rhizophagus irregularis TaxID=588596 RepID=A0A2N1MIJ5_9GLOM|nr:hypothetical protein RhiirC2_791791 [Rhizophagus irregularis]
MTPLTPLTLITPIHYNPSKTSISSPSSSSPLHEMEILQPNDNWSHRHFKIIGDSNDHSGRHLSRIFSSPTLSSSILKIN